MTISVLLPLGWGSLKLPSLIPPCGKILILHICAQIVSFQSRSYLSGVSAAKLRQPLENVNVIFNSHLVFSRVWNKMEKLPNRTGLVAPTPGLHLPCRTPYCQHDGNNGRTGYKNRDVSSLSIKTWDNNWKILIQKCVIYLTQDINCGYDFNYCVYNFPWGIVWFHENHILVIWIDISWHIFFSIYILISTKLYARTVVCTLWEMDIWDEFGGAFCNTIYKTKLSVFKINIFSSIQSRIYTKIVPLLAFKHQFFDI